RLAFADSRGYLLEPEEAALKAINQIASGPAAAALAASHICRRHDARLAIMMDVGSVSTDIVLIEDLVPASSLAGTFAGVPMRQPMTDVGSIALGGKSRITVRDTVIALTQEGNAGAASLSDALAMLGLLPEEAFPGAG